MPATFSVPARSPAFLTAAADERIGEMNVLAPRAPARRHPWRRRSCGPKASTGRRRAPRYRRGCAPPPAPHRHAAVRRPHARWPPLRRPAAPRRSRYWPASPRPAAAQLAWTTASASAARLTRPSASTGMSSMASRQNRPPARTEGCSIADINSRSRGRFSPAVSIAGVSASMLASVPLEVKITSAGRASTSAATCLARLFDQPPGRAPLGMHRGRIADEPRAPPARRAAPPPAAAPWRSNRDRRAPSLADAL